MTSTPDTLTPAMLARIFEYTADPVCLLAGDGTIVYANPAALGVLSPPVDALVGRVLWHLAGWTLASANALAQAIAQMGHTPHEPLRVETSVTAPQGVLTWEVSLTPLLNSKGHLTQILVETRDVTRHHALVERLQASEARLEEAQHLAQFGSWTWDIAHNQLEWSESLYRVFGIDPARKPLRIEDYLALLTRKSTNAYYAAVSGRSTPKPPKPTIYISSARMGHVGFCTGFGTWKPTRRGTWCGRMARRKMSPTSVIRSGC